MWWYICWYILMSFLNFHLKHVIIIYEFLLNCNENIFKLKYKNKKHVLLCSETIHFACQKTILFISSPRGCQKKNDLTARWFWNFYRQWFSFIFSKKYQLFHQDVVCILFSKYDLRLKTASLESGILSSDW